MTPNILGIKIESQPWIFVSKERGGENISGWYGHHLTTNEVIYVGNVFWRKI